MSKRTDMVAALRAMADDLEAGKLPLPYDFSTTVYWQLDEETGNINDQITQADARKAMSASPGAWEKRGMKEKSAYITYLKTYSQYVTYGISIPRPEVCKQVQVGVRHVEAHDEPVYEWRCE